MGGWEFVIGRPEGCQREARRLSDGGWEAGSSMRGHHSHCEGGGRDAVYYEQYARTAFLLGGRKAVQNEHYERTTFYMALSHVCPSL